MVMVGKGFAPVFCSGKEKAAGVEPAAFVFLHQEV
jgi:hypothetical protein